MKNYLKYYYNIDVLNIHRNQNIYSFVYKNYNFYFFPYFGDLKKLNELYDVVNEIQRRGYYCNKIIKNRDSNIVTLIGNMNYILLMYKNNLNKKIDIYDIVNFKHIPISNTTLNCSNWKKLWEEKIDYFEYQLSQFGNKHSLVRESFAYYAGYVELAISLLNDVSIKSNNMSLVHKRIKKESTLYDLYDPFNFAVDNRVRDAAEYFKSKIFDGDVLNQISEYFKQIKFSSDEYTLFFIRMLYPSFYFDEYEKIMNNNLEDNLLSNILDKNQQYELFIKNLYKYMLNFCNLPMIEWLN